LDSKTATAFCRNETQRKGLCVFEQEFLNQIGREVANRIPADARLDEADFFQMTTFCYAALPSFQRRAVCSSHRYNSTDLASAATHRFMVSQFLISASWLISSNVSCLSSA
jgi:hypothetical protein